MKTLEVIEPLSTAESIELQRLEFVILKSQKHVDNWIEAVREIRDQRLYRGEFTTFADYCAKKLKKAVRSVQLAFQLDEVKKEIAQSSAHAQDTETAILAPKLSANVVTKLAKVPKAKRVAVLKEAAKQTGGKPTASAVSKVAAQMLHRKLERPPEARDNSNAYTSSPAPKRGTLPPPRTNAPAAKASANKPAISNHAAQDAIERIEWVYENQKAWFNDVPPRTPRAIVDKLIEGLRE